MIKTRLIVSYFLLPRKAQVKDHELILTANDSHWLTRSMLISHIGRNLTPEEEKIFNLHYIPQDE